MELQKLTIDNFKGIGHFVFEPNGADADIYGTNETGKTTLMDAFVWLLTDKDSQNSAQFSIKPIGGLKKGAQVGVEGVFDIHGKPLTLKKIYAEVWTKRRGSASKEFTGHETLYFVNGVPVKLKGYNEKLKEICDPGLFRLLTNPRYVNEEMKWQDRRKLLIDVCGDISDEDVIKSNEKFADIPAMIEGKTADEFRAEIEYARKGINKELQAIPVRIDELSKSLPDNPQDPASLTKEKAASESKIAELQKELSTIAAGGAVALKKKDLLDVENDIRGLEDKIALDHRAEVDRQSAIVRAAEVDFMKAKEEVETIGRAIEAITEDIEAKEFKINELRDEWQAENAKAFSAEKTCPTCGQAIPKDQIQEARRKFNTIKADKLAEINATGKRWSDRLSSLKKEYEKFEKELSAAKDNADKAHRVMEEARETLDGIKNAPAAKPTKEHQAALDKREELRKEITRLESEAPDTSHIEAEIKELKNHIGNLEDVLYDIKTDEKTRARIKDLSKQEKELAAEYERLEARLQLMEDFTRAKCDMLTDKINNQFQITKWVLFEDQINGGIKDVCTATVGGVPYPDLNNASKINVGLDVVSALSKHYGVSLPIFVDNAESIVSLFPVEGQLIRLIVSEEDKALRVETTKEADKKAA